MSVGFSEYTRINLSIDEREAGKHACHKPSLIDPNLL